MLESNPSEVLRRPRVGDHPLDPIVGYERQGELEVVDPGGFDTDARRGSPAREDTDELAVAGPVVGERHRPLATVDGTTSSLAPTSIPASTIRFIAPPRCTMSLGSPDPEPLSTDLVDPGSWASHTPRHRQRGRGIHLTRRLTRPQATTISPNERPSLYPEGRQAGYTRRHC